MPRLIALTLALLSLTAGVLLSSGGLPAQGRGDFRHGRHVSLLWPGIGASPTEVPRDCRGCHDYSQSDPAQNPRPSDACARCHVLDSMTFDVAGARVDPALEATRAFRHFDHLTDRDGTLLACSVCHADGEVLSGRRTRGDEPPIVIPPVDAAFCGSCHAADSPGQAGFDAALSAAAVRRAEDPRADAERRFRHADHLSPAALAGLEPDACSACHPDISRADALHLSEHQLSLAGCAQCHTGTQYTLGLRPRPSSTAATFVHAYHLGTLRGRPGLEAAGERLREESCSVCHAFSPAQETFVVREFLSAPGRGQAGCVECHGDWSVPNHGRNDACSQCHALEEGSLADLAAQATNRPRTSVLRADPSAFRIGPHSHPFIHGEQGAAEDCARCHVASVPHAPSRIGTQPFEHATHLPAELLRRPPGEVPSSACTGCHTSIAQAISIDGIVGTRHGELGSGASYNFEQSSCASCHAGSVVEPLVAEPLLPREALAFDHRAHLAKPHPLEPERRMTCVDCHALEDAAGALRIVLGTKVQNCTLCHGHDGPRAAVTAALDRNGLDACTACHAPGVPRRGQAIEVERAHLAEIRGSHRHDSGAGCAACHAGATEGPLARAEVASRLFASWTTSFSPHFAANRQRSTWPFFQDRAACLDCHWGNMERPYQQVRDQFQRQKNSPLERVREAGDLPQEGEYRRRFGAQLEGFPGLGSR